MEENPPYKNQLQATITTYSFYIFQNYFSLRNYPFSRQANELLPSNYFPIFVTSFRLFKRTSGERKEDSLVLDSFSPFLFF